MQRLLTALFLFGILMFLETTGLTSSAAHAQPAPAVQGDYTGSLGALRVQLHIRVAKTIALSHELRNEAGPNMHRAFGWLHEDATGNYWHNGGTGGYSSFVFFNPDADCAAVVLVNQTLGPQGSLADLIGHHIGQRFAGQPAISLGD